MTSALSAEKIHHIGLVIESIKKYLKRSPLEKTSEIIADESQKIRVCFVKNPNHDFLIELIEPTDENSAVSAFLKKKGPGYHHVCFKLADIKSAEEFIKNKNFLKISGPLESKILPGKKIIWALSKEKELIEFLTA